MVVRNVETNEVVKIFHDVVTPSNDRINFSCSPYHKPTLEEFQAWVDLGCPLRVKGNFSNLEDIQKAGDTPISQWLDMELRMRRNVRKRDGYYYRSISHFMKKECRYFDSRGLTDSEEELIKDAVERFRHEPRERECYYTSQLLATNDIGSPLIYTEGYAYKDNLPLAIQHAWITLNGKVVDLTWKEDGEPIIGRIPKGYHYYGLQFDSRYVSKKLCDRGTADSLIDCYQEGFDLFKKKFNHYTK